MKQKCPTCNAVPDKDIFGMCSECGAINRPYEDLLASAPAQTKREGFVTLAIVVSITAGVLVGLVAFSSMPTELKYILIYCIGFAAAKLID